MDSWHCWFTHEGTITVDTMDGTAVCRRPPGSQEDIIGRKVDLNTPGFLSSYFRDGIEGESEVQYVTA